MLMKNGRDATPVELQTVSSKRTHRDRHWQHMKINR